MNDKIKLLVKEHFVRDEYTEFGWQPCQRYEFDEAELGKFVESIILEAVNAVMDGTKEGDHYAQRIEQHFDNGTGGILHYGDKE